MASNPFEKGSRQNPSSTPLIREFTPGSEVNSFLGSLKSKPEREEARPTYKNKQYITTHISSSFGRWWPELLSCTFAVAVFLVLVFVLRPHQGRVLSSWPLAITINTFVAICTLLIKASLAMIISNGIGQLKWVWYSKARPLGDLQQYDSASRGVVGSLGLLWTHRNGRRLIPVLGAILTIILTLVDPFGQALVQTESCSVIDPSFRSTISAAHHAKLTDSSDTFVLMNGATVSMMIGMLNESLIPPVVFECPTGNCTYPKPYHSAGYCSKCSDVSDQVKVISNNHTLYWEAPNITLASDIGSQYMGGTTFVMDMVVADPTSANNIASLQIMASELTKCVDNTTTPWRCRTYGAAVCEISPCVISYTGEVDTGTLKETIIDTSEVWSTGVDIDDQFMGSVEVYCLNTSERDALQHAGFDISSDTKWLAYNVTFVHPTSEDLINETTIRPECLYVTDNQEMDAIYSIFETVFQDAYVASVSSKAGYRIDGQLHWQALWNRGIVDFADIQRMSDGLVKGMTSFARNNPTNLTKGEFGERSWNGTSYRTTTCVRIQWQWITYLVAALSGVLMFLIGTMIMTRTTLEVNGQDYKTSILPLMFHGVAFSDAEASFKNPGFINDMTEDAENIYVQFQAAERGWQFVEKKMA